MAEKDPPNGVLRDVKQALISFNSRLHKLEKMSITFLERTGAISVSVGKSDISFTSVYYIFTLVYHDTGKKTTGFTDFATVL